MNIKDLKDLVLIDIYDNWQLKTRKELSEVPTLIQLANNIYSLKYYIEHQLLSYPYDLVDGEDISSLEYHIEYYFNMFKNDFE